MDFQKPNEIADLKNFMLSLRSGNLLQVIESNQIHFQEKYNAVASRAKQSEEELARQKLIIKQNAHLIEKFQNQLQELSNENAKLLEKQQVVGEENATLKEQLLCSEEKFAQLDIAYDQQVSLLDEKIQDLETQVKTLENRQSQDINRFDQAQTELNEKIAKSEEENQDLRRQLETLQSQQEDERTKLKEEVLNLNTVNTDLKGKIKKMEQETNHLHKNLTGAMSGIKQVNDLEIEVNKLRLEQESRLLEHQREKNALTKINDDLKSKEASLKKKLLSKEQEIEDLHIKFKELSRIASAIPDQQPMFGKFVRGKRSSTDDLKTLDNTSDSDSSSISFYKPPKMKKKSVATDDESVKRYRKVFGNKRKSGGALNAKTNTGSSEIAENRTFVGFHQHIEIPESPYSPVVSSSAFNNPDQE